MINIIYNINFASILARRILFLLPFCREGIRCNCIDEIRFFCIWGILQLVGQDADANHEHERLRPVATLLDDTGKRFCRLPPVPRAAQALKECDHS